MVAIKIPVNFIGGLLDYVLSFSQAFIKHQQLKGCLDSVEQNIKQAKLLGNEPLALFACLTAEEEAARYLYLCLKKKGYDLPRYDRLTSHHDKARIILWALVFEEYYFNFFSQVLIEYFMMIKEEGKGVRVSVHGRFDEKYWLELPNVLQTTATAGSKENEEIDDLEAEVVRKSLRSSLSRNFGSDHSISTIVNHIANRRNKCLYGPPSKKLTLSNDDELTQFENNCSAMIILGYLVFQDNEKWPSVQLICRELGNLLSEKSG